MDKKNNAGVDNSGYWNSGYGNSTNRSSGIFNNSESTIIVFGKDSGKKWDEINHPHFAEFYLTKWISESDMTDQEKIDSPEFHVRSGYLKKFEYKEVWTNFWKDTDEANRKKFLDLPNFSSAIFLDITGIDVGKAMLRESFNKEGCNSLTTCSRAASLEKRGQYGEI